MSSSPPHAQGYHPVTTRCLHAQRHTRANIQTELHIQTSRQTRTLYFERAVAVKDASAACGLLRSFPVAEPVVNRGGQRGYTFRPAGKACKLDSRRKRTSSARTHPMSLLVRSTCFKLPVDRNTCANAAEPCLPTRFPCKYSRSRVELRAKPAGHADSRMSCYVLRQFSTMKHTKAQIRAINSKFISYLRMRSPSASACAPCSPMSLYGRFNCLNVELCSSNIFSA